MHTEGKRGMGVDAKYGVLHLALRNNDGNRFTARCQRTVHFRLQQLCRVNVRLRVCFYYFSTKSVEVELPPTTSNIRNVCRAVCAKLTLPCTSSKFTLK